MGPAARVLAGPIPLDDEWKVAKLLGRQDLRLLSLEEATPLIVERLEFQKADEAFTHLISDLRSEAKVEIDRRALEAFEIPK